MSEISNQEIDDVVREAGARFIRQPGCVANKPNMLELLETLEDYTDEVQEAAERYGIADDEYVPQWAKDMNNWRLRLAGYYDALGKARYDTGSESCEELRASVNEPLLVGWYEAGTPGIVNPDVQTVADVATAYMLGNQVIVYRDHQRERLQKLLEDLNMFSATGRETFLNYWCEKTGTCGPGGWGSGCDTACWLRRIAIGLGVTGGAYLTYRLARWGLSARVAALPRGAAPQAPPPPATEVRSDSRPPSD